MVREIGRAISVPEQAKNLCQSRKTRRFKTLTNDIKEYVIRAYESKVNARVNSQLPSSFLVEHVAFDESLTLANRIIEN